LSLAPIEHFVKLLPVGYTDNFALGIMIHDILCNDEIGDNFALAYIKLCGMFP
jgi:hypothetical protein